ncbi:MAG: hypothetical protein JW741_12445 [Sedimentisphaerales bacterium]|nr:hypothetical protein [Sedimentisphaerales bacterium]
MLYGLAKIRAEVLKENAPKLYRELKAAGKLENHCNRAAEQVRNSIQAAKEKGLNLASLAPSSGCRLPSQISVKPIRHVRRAWPF